MIDQFVDMNRAREEAIIDFIRYNQGCSATNVYNESAKSLMSYQTFYNILFRLKQQEVIQVEKKNNREHSLSLNENNLLVKASKELDEFEQAIFSLFDKVLIELKKSPQSITRHQKRLAELGGQEGISIKGVFVVSHEELFFSTLYLFQLMMSNYILKLSVSWIGTVSDKAFLARVQNIVLNRIAEQYVKLNKKLDEVDEEKDLGLKLNKNKVNGLKEYVVNRFSDMFNPHQYDDLYDKFEFYNLAEDFQKVYYADALSIKG